MPLEKRRFGMAGFTSKAVKLTLLVMCLAGVPSAWVLAGGASKLVTTDSSGVAIKGYDTVAYFTEGQAIKGNPEFAFSWQDAQWYFSNARHRDLFAANPELYAPQFGGYCANGLSKGKVVAADPEEWTIVDGKLYIKFNRSARDSWRQDKTAKIKKAEEKWADLHN
jgi:hypothetical protein